MLLHSLKHRASWLVRVCAIRETAVFGEAEYLPEIASQFPRLHIERAEALDTRRVYDPTVRLHGEHLAEGGGVRALIVGVADTGRAQVRPRYQGVDDGGLPHSAVAAEQCDLALEHGTQLIHAISCNCRDGQAVIAYGVIQRAHHVEIVPLLRCQQIGLVEHQNHGHSVRLGRGKKAVYECCGCLGVAYSDDKHGLIHVGGNDMALPRQVRGLAYDIVAAVLYLCDKGSILACHDNGDPVADGHGVSAAYALQAEGALHLAVYRVAAVRQYGVPGACALYYCTGQVLWFGGYRFWVVGLWSLVIRLFFVIVGCRSLVVGESYPSKPMSHNQKSATIKA